MRPLPVCLALAALALTSCREAKVESYRVARETPKPAPAQTAAPASAPLAGGNMGETSMASTPVTTASGESLKWSAPAHWTAKPAVAMRKGSYAITGENNTEADLSITAFPGDVGGDLANANRWRAQLQLGPLSETDFAQHNQHLDYNGLHMTVVDFTGAGQRTVGAMIPFDGSTWFFKLMGPEPIVAREKDAFLAFLQTIQQP